MVSCCGLYGNGGTLSGVTVRNGVLLMDNYYPVGYALSWAPLTVVNGLVLNGTALLGDAGDRWSGRIDFVGSQTLSGNGTVVFGPGGTSYLHLQNSGTVLTVGSGITLRGQSALIDGDQNTAMVNAGNNFSRHQQRSDQYRRGLEQSGHGTGD